MIRETCILVGEEVNGKSPANGRGVRQEDVWEQITPLDDLHLDSFIIDLANSLRENYVVFGRGRTCKRRFLIALSLRMMRYTNASNRTLHVRLGNRRVNSESHASRSICALSCREPLCPAENKNTHMQECGTRLQLLKLLEFGSQSERLQDTPCMFARWGRMSANAC